MQDKRKIRLFLSIGGLFVVIVLGGLIYLGIRVLDSEKQITPATNTTVTKSNTFDSTQSSFSSEQSTRTTESTQRSVSQTESSVNDSSHSEKKDATEAVKKFLSVYYTWELQDKSVSDRAKLLKEQMSKDCYEAQAIEADSEQLKELIQTYEKKKEINTSNSTQLVSSRYLSSQIYQDTTDQHLYNIKLKIDQKAPYQKTGTVLSKELQLRYSDNKVTQIKDVTNH